MLEMKESRDWGLAVFRKCCYCLLICKEILRYIFCMVTSVTCLKRFWQTRAE